MHPRSPPPLRRRARPPVLAALVAVFALITSLFAAAPATAATPADVATALGGNVVKTAAVVGFNPENIINDTLFYDSYSMSAAEIQAFLDAKIGTCKNGNCLNVLNTGISTRDAVSSQSTGNLICSAIQGGTMKVSELIYRVQVACGISAKVILVTLQKEQGLVTSTAPSEWALKAAMGASCPDTAPCDPAFAGVGPQILKGAQQLKTYKAAEFAKQPGVNWVGYSPNSACGGTNLNIANYATAALYSYTPYQPNAAALAAGYGLGDGCSSYGNRNFYNYYTAWFGSTQATVDPCKAPPASAITAAGGEYVTTASLNGRAAPTTECSNVLATFPTGTRVTRLGVVGVWWQVKVGGIVYWVHSDYLTTAPDMTYTVGRIGGIDRYETAIKVSQSTYPSGAGTVMLASGTDFPDALAAGAAAGVAGASLLLTDPGALPSSVAAELTRLKATRVILIGGEDRVSSAVRASVQSVLPGAAIERIAGRDRTETSLLLAARFFPTATAAYVVDGRNFADAVVAAALGGAKGMPVILVPGGDAGLSSDMSTRIKALGAGIRSVIVAGSTASVSSGIESSIKAAGVATTRIGGIDRYETSYLLNVNAYPNGATSVLFATGALTGSVLAGRGKVPLFSTPTTCMADAPKTWLLTSKVTRVTLIGGLPSLSEAVAASVRC